MSCLGRPGPACLDADLAAGGGGRDAGLGEEDAEPAGCPVSPPVSIDPDSASLLTGLNSLVLFPTLSSAGAVGGAKPVWWGPDVLGLLADFCVAAALMTLDRARTASASPSSS